MTTAIPTIDVADVAARPEVRIRATITSYGRDLLQARIASAETVDAPALADEMTAHFLSDPQMEANIKQLIRTMCYDAVLGELAHTRRERVNAAGPQARKIDPTERWKRWVEHAQERHVLLLDMGKVDLLAAAEERERAAGTSLTIAALERRLAKGLQGEERVRDRYSAADIERLHTEIASKPIRLAPVSERIALGPLS